ncbi:hypothetical protein GCM10027294_25530 [Marinactinospora endophytica]
MGIACRLCAQPATGVVCAACVGRMRAALAAVHGDDGLHGLDVDLDIALARQTALGATRGRGTGAVPLPIDVRASEAAAVLRSTLSTWVRVLAGEMAGPLPEDTLAGMARWLHAHASRIAAAEWADEAVDEIVHAVGEVRRAVDRPAPRILAGRCACGAVLYVRPGAVRAVCYSHEEPLVHDVDELRAALAAEAEGVAATATVLASHMAALGMACADSTIRGWARPRGERPALIEACGTDGRGRPVYRLEDVKRVWRASRERRLVS